MTKKGTVSDKHSSGLSILKLLALAVSVEFTTANDTAIGES